MKTVLKVVLGVAIFVSSLVGVSALHTEVSYAATATSETQLAELVKSLKKVNDREITGKLSNQNIVFKSSGSSQNFTTEDLVCEQSATGGTGRSYAAISSRSDNSYVLIARYSSSDRCLDYQSSVFQFNASGEVRSVNGDPIEPENNAGLTEENSANAGEIDCDTSGFNLSLIICPIIELGMNTTDFVFSSLIAPLLEDVPVSSNPEDGTYKAWQVFRYLGNVILVGTMLAVVYAQIRGDR